MFLWVFLFPLSFLAGILIFVPSLVCPALALRLPTNLKVIH
jgi:hypothetical protein